MIDYLADLYVDVLILLSCICWMALLFWVPIWAAEKFLRWMYQDVPQQLYISEDAHELEPAECVDCGGMHMLDAERRCDLCVSIQHAVLEHWRDAREIGEDVPYVSGSGAHDYDPLDFEDHDLHDHEDLVADGRVIRRMCIR